jgi:hypothetical protein
VRKPKPLIETHPLLRDPELRRAILEWNVYDSSVFEGARGLPKPTSKRPRLRPRSKASSKKAMCRE